MIEIQEEMIHMLTSDEKLNAWGVGEWVEEADKCYFKYREYECFIKRMWHKHDDGNIELGHLCGYLNIPKTHPWYGKTYDHIDCEVHGGLTFSQEEISNDWFIGFDCGHNMDISPGLQGFKNHFNAQFKAKYPFASPMLFESSYKNMAFVQKELMHLVDQAIEVDQRNVAST